MMQPVPLPSSPAPRQAEESMIVRVAPFSISKATQFSTSGKGFWYLYVLSDELLRLRLNWISMVQPLRSSTLSSVIFMVSHAARA